MQASVKLYSLSYSEAKTYIFALLFVAGNILLPQLCHLAPGGGLMWLPIYFFTLVAAYKYGLRVGLLTALFSPLVNNLIFGMPAAEMLPVVLAKSALLASAAAYAAHRVQKIAFVTLVAVVFAYQSVGTLAEWAILGDLFLSLQHLRLAVAGMIVQVFGGYAVLKAMSRI